jgi:hypothetical protein
MPLQKEAMVSVVVLLDRVPCNTARVFFLLFGSLTLWCAMTRVVTASPPLVSAKAFLSITSMFPFQKYLPKSLWMCDPLFLLHYIQHG